MPTQIIFDLPPGMQTSRLFHLLSGQSIHIRHYGDLETVGDSNYRISVTPGVKTERIIIAISDIASISRIYLPNGRHYLCDPDIHNIPETRQLSSRANRAALCSSDCLARDDLDCAIRNVPR